MKRKPLRKSKGREQPPDVRPLPVKPNEESRKPPHALAAGENGVSCGPINSEDDGEDTDEEYLDSEDLNEAEFGA